MVFLHGVTGADIETSSRVSILLSFVYLSSVRLLSEGFPALAYDPDPSSYFIVRTSKIIPMPSTIKGHINLASMASGLEDSLLSIALTGDITQMRALLIACQESPSEETIQRALTAATKCSYLDIVKFMLHQYPSTSLNEEIVRGAVNTGSIPIFETLLARDPSIINMQFDRRGTPLIVACMGRQKAEFLYPQCTLRTPRSLQ